MRIATNFKNWYTLLPRAFENYFRFFSPGSKTNLLHPCAKNNEIWRPHPPFGIAFWVITHIWLISKRKISSCSGNQDPQVVSRASTSLVLDMFKKFDTFGPIMGWVTLWAPQGPWGRGHCKRVWSLVLLSWSIAILKSTFTKNEAEPR